MFQGCFKSFSKKFQENVQGVSKKFHFAWHSSQLPEQKEGLFNVNINETTKRKQVYWLLTQLKNDRAYRVINFWVKKMLTRKIWQKIWQICLKKSCVQKRIQKSLFKNCLSKKMLGLIKFWINFF